MNEIFADRLTDAIARKASPICVGIDPMWDMLPPAMTHSGKILDGSEGALEIIEQFSRQVLHIVAPIVPIVKFQSAYFEKFGWQGVRSYFRLIQHARQLGLLVIGDIKRGDIGSTATAYASGHLSPAADMQASMPDAITVNPMLGMDTLEPFVAAARMSGKGLFVLVRTSNPGSADLQDVKLADGRTWSEMLAEKVATIAAEKTLVGSSGWSSIGAVVGATQTHTMRSLRKLLPQSIFLLPGYGAQGATAEMTQAAFRDGHGAIVSASRSILYAHREKKYADIAGDWQKCVQGAVTDMQEDLRRIILIK